MQIEVKAKARYLADKDLIESDFLLTIDSPSSTVELKINIERPFEETGTSIVFIKGGEVIFIHGDDIEANAENAKYVALLALTIDNLASLLESLEKDRNSEFESCKTNAVADEYTQSLLLNVLGLLD